MGTSSDPDGNGTPELRFLGGEGRAAFARGEIDSARVIFERWLEQSSVAGDSSAIADALAWLAQTAFWQGDYRSTRELGERGLALKLRMGLDGDLFRSYNTLGLLAWNEARLLDASDLFQKAAAAASAAGDSADLAKVANNMGLVATSLGRYEEARDEFMTARRAAGALSEPRIEGRTLINLAMLSVELGDPRAAVGYLDEARPLLMAAGDAVGEQVLLSQLGSAYRNLGEPDRAVAYLDSALARSRATGLRQEQAINQEMLAELHLDIGNPRRALELFARAREINEELGLLDDLAIDLRSEAEIHADLGSPELALEKAREALRIHREIESPLQVIFDLVLLADLSLAAGRSAEATSYSLDAERSAAELGLRSARAYAALSRARIAERIGDPTGALELLSAASADLAGAGYEAEAEAERLRSRAFAQRGQLDAALAAGRRSLASVERVRARLGSAGSRASYLRRWEEVYEDQVELLLRAGALAEALEVADAARGRALLEHLAVPSQKASEPRAAAGQLAGAEGLLRRVQELVARLDEIDEYLLYEETPGLRAEADSLSRQLERTRAEYAARLTRVRETDPRGLSLLGGHSTPTPAVAGALAADEAVLEYLVTPDRLHIFLLTVDSLAHFASEIESETLASRVRIVRELSSRGAQPANLEVPLRRLYEVLVRPVVESGLTRHVDRLFVIPHRELFYVPFAALLDESGDFLAQKYALVHLPSSAALPVLRAAGARVGQRAASTSSMTLPAPEAAGFAPFPADLPASVEEIGALRHAASSHATFEGSDATETEFRRALHEAGIVHAATHGILNARNPMFSRLELAPGSARRSFEAAGAEATLIDDGRFEVHELLNVPVAAWLVFLSGCETGGTAAWATGFAAGDDYATLSRAFLYAGARNVISTLWPVEDEGAAAFANAFYAALSTSAPVEAFAEAQRFLAVSDRFSAPYYWAGYQLSGDGNGAAAQDRAELSVQSDGSTSALLPRGHR